jgi:hypothetical protein
MVPVAIAAAGPLQGKLMSEEQEEGAGGYAVANLLYLNSASPLDANGLTFNLATAVQLPGVGPSTLWSTLNVHSAFGVVVEGASSKVDGAGIAFSSSVSGFTNLTIGASNVNALAVNYAACQAPITFTNGLRQPTQPSSFNGAVRFAFSYFLSDGATYSVTVNLSISAVSAFATTHDLLGNPYQVVTGITGTRTYSYLPTGAQVVSQVTWVSSASAHFYPYALLSSAPGVYTMANAAYLDAEGLTFSITPQAPSNGAAPGVGSQCSSVTVHVVTTNQTVTQLNEGAYTSAPLLAVQQQLYLFGKGATNNCHLIGQWRGGGVDVRTLVKSSS